MIGNRLFKKKHLCILSLNFCQQRFLFFSEVGDGGVSIGLQLLQLVFQQLDFLVLLDGLHTRLLGNILPALGLLCRLLSRILRLLLGRLEILDFLLLGLHQLAQSLIA